jgi:hypothetical protein
MAKFNLMKSPLKISLLLNLGLSVCLVVVLKTHNEKESVSPPQVITSSLSPVIISKPAALARQSAKPFHWSQLESTNDYRVYVANLRDIGCPEPTVQDIVRGDAARGFSFERNQLGLDGTGTGKWSRLQEAQTVASLLGEPAPVAEAGAPEQVAENRTQLDGRTAVGESPAGIQGGSQTAEVAGVTQNALQQSAHRVTVSAPAYPLVFQNVNADMGLNDSQKAAIQQLQQQFVNDVGGPNQDPSNPAYLASWQSAQNNADNMLLIYVGWQIYSKYQIEAWQNSLTSQGASPQ